MVNMVSASKEKRNNEIWLHGIGWTAAVKAADVKPGTVTVWNYGYKDIVKDVIKSKSGKTVDVILVSENGHIGSRKFRSDRLIGIA